jgi:hypothetical protein
VSNVHIIVKIQCLKYYKMLVIINRYKLMAVFVVDNCLVASLFLVLQTSIALRSELDPVL